MISHQLLLGHGLAS